LNGFSEGAAYGDDAQMASNYPIVRLTSSDSTHVYYATTSHWSSTGVQTGSTPEYVNFTIPSSLPSDTYSLQVVASGVPSQPTTFAYPYSYGSNDALNVQLSSGSPHLLQVSLNGSLLYSGPQAQ